MSKVGEKLISQTHESSNYSARILPPFLFICKQEFREKDIVVYYVIVYSNFLILLAGQKQEKTVMMAYMGLRDEIGGGELKKGVYENLIL